MAIKLQELARSMSNFDSLRHIFFLFPVACFVCSDCSATQFVCRRDAAYDFERNGCEPNGILFIEIIARHRMRRSEDDWTHQFCLMVCEINLNWEHLSSTFWKANLNVTLQRFCVSFVLIVNWVLPHSVLVYVCVDVSIFKCILYFCF